MHFVYEIEIFITNIIFMDIFVMLQKCCLCPMMF